MKVIIDEHNNVNAEFEGFDSWNLDTTLALLIAPALEWFKPQFEDWTVFNRLNTPETLSVVADYNIPDENIEDADKEFTKILFEEMIFAFKCVSGAIDKNFSSNPEQLGFEKVVDENGEESDLFVFTQQKDKTKPPSVYDREGADKHFKRIQRGLNLFGQYFQQLWT